MTFEADNTQVGAGQLYPQDYADDFAVINFIVRQIIAEMETCTPVSVKAVHAGTGTPPAGGTVDVQLLVSLVDGSANVQKQGVVYGLPYFRMQSQNWAIVADPAVGDFGFIVSASRDISNVVKTPGQANPGSYRQHSFSDGFFIPCSFNTAAPQAYAWFKSDGSVNITTKDGIVISSDGSGNLTVTAQGNATVKANGGAFDLTATNTTLHGNLTVTGSTTLQGSVTATSGTASFGAVNASSLTATGQVTANSGASQVTLSLHQHSALNAPPTPGH